MTLFLFVVLKSYFFFFFFDKKLADIKQLMGVRIFVSHYKIMEGRT